MFLVKQSGPIWSVRKQGKVWCDRQGLQPDACRPAGTGTSSCLLYPTLLWLPIWAEIATEAFPLKAALEFTAGRRNPGEVLFLIQSTRGCGKKKFCVGQREGEGVGEISDVSDPCLWLRVHLGKAKHHTSPSLCYLQGFLPNRCQKGPCNVNVTQLLVDICCSKRGLYSKCGHALIWNQIFGSLEPTHLWLVWLWVMKFRVQDFFSYCHA